MLIKSLDEYKQFDVFLGHGWENWLRVKHDHNKVTVLKSSVPDIEPQTLRLVYFKIKKLLDRQEKHDE